MPVIPAFRSKASKERAAARGLTPVPGDVKRRVERGRRSADRYAPLWRECLAFFDNNHYVERSAVDGQLHQLETREGGKGKPRWRPRLTRNRYTPAIERERAAMAARIPRPRVTAPSHNAEAINAAKLSEKVCQSIYAVHHVKQLVLDLFVWTYNCGGGYVWLYWNADTGPFIADPINGTTVRQGDLGTWKLGPEDVLWEPGKALEDSRWVAVRRAMPVDEVLAMAGYCGPEELKRDATSTGGHGEDRRDATAAELVFVIDYLERPSTKIPAGRSLRFANDHLIVPEAEYPCDDDRMVIHGLEHTRRPHRDRPMGLGELLVDVQRTYNRTINQLIVWKNLVLNPQLLAPKGSVRTARTGEPGTTVEYVPKGGQVPAWAPVPEIPVSIFRTLDQCIADFQDITGQQMIPAAVDSGVGVAGYQGVQDERRAVVAENLARFYKSFFEHALYLVQRHYTEPRLLQVKTRFGTETIADFMGAQIGGSITVEVDPRDVMPRSPEAQEAQLIMYADRGWIPPHQALAAIRSGDADSIIDEFELDIAKAQREIQQLIAMGLGEGNGVVFASPADNHEVHIWLLDQWLKTEDFERQPEEVQQAALLHREQHSVEMQVLAFQEAMAQQETAAANGRENATRPAQEGGEVSRPGLESTVRGVQGQPSQDG